MTDEPTGEAPKLSAPTNVAVPKLTQPTVHARTPRRWPRIALRWIRRVIVGVLALAVVAVIAVVIILHTDWGRDLLRRQVEAQLQAKLPGGATIGKLEGSVFGELVVRDIELDGRDGKPMVSVATLKVEVALGALFAAKVHADSVEASGVKVDIHPQPPAPAEPVEPAPAPSSGTVWRVELPEIVVRDAHVVVATESGQAVLEHVRVGAAFTMPRRGPMRVEASVNATWNGRPVLAVAIARYGSGELEVPYASLVGTDADDPDAAPGKPSVSVSAVDVHLGGDRGIAGAVTVRATAHAAATLAPIDAAMVPGDVFALIDGDGDRVGLDATVGRSRLFARGRVDIATLTWRGLAGLTSEDLTNLSDGAVAGRGTVAVAAIVSPTLVRGVLGVAGAVEEPVESEVTLAFDGAPDRAEVIAVAERGKVSHAVATAEVTRKAGVMTLTRARVTGVAHDLPGVGGTVFFDADARGMLLPTTALAIDAEVDGEAVSYGTTSVAGVQAHVTGYEVPRASTGHVHFTATDVRSGATQLPQAVVDADLVVTPDNTLAFDNVVHQLRTNAGTWSGSGGTVKLALGAAQPTLTVTALHTGTGASNLTVATATVSPATGDLAATITAQGVAVAAVVPGQPGAVDATVDVARKGGAWSGKLHVDAHGVGTTAMPVDGSLDVGVHGHTLAIAAHAAQAKLGDVSLSLDVDGPRDLADVAAWRRLTRRAITRADVAIHGDAAGLGATGVVTGALTIEAGDLRGAFHVDGVHAGPETAVADVTLAAGSGDQIVADAAATVSGVIAPHAEVRFALPERVFDPAAWLALDRTALVGAVVHLDDTALDHATLLALGVDTPYTARVTATVNVDPAARGARVTATLSQLAGGTIVKPIDVDVAGGIDDHGGHGEVVVTAGTLKLFEASGTTPLTVDRALAGDAPHAALAATLSTPDLAAADAMAIIGRDEITNGTLRAAIDVGGTLEAPTGTAEITLKGLVLAPILAGQKSPELAALTVEAAVGDAAQQLDVTGHEAGGGELHASIRSPRVDGRPLREQIDAATASLDATAFDIAPVVAFLPGTLAAMTGTITTAHLSYDPKVGHPEGSARLAHTSIPLSAQLGTFRDAGVDVAIDNDHIHSVIGGKLGEGTVNADATIAMAGLTPKTLDATATLDNVSPLGAIRPKVHAKITAGLTYAAGAGKWTGKIKVDDATASASLKFADDLFPIGAPDDIRFVDGAWKPPAVQSFHIPPKSEAWLDVDIAIAPATIEVHDPSSHKLLDPKAALGGIVGVAHATVEGTLELTYGDDGLGLYKTIVTDTGDIELVGRRYDVEHAVLNFDGSIYPNIDAAISHTFPAGLTLTIPVVGRLPGIEKPTPTSNNPALSDPDQLWAIVFGGDPGGDPANAAQDAGAAAGVALASAFVGNSVNQGLAKAHVPVKVDVLRYTAATATSSAAFEVGKWLRNSLYIAYRQHLDALPTENINEGELQYYFQKGPKWLRRVLIDSSVGDREYDSVDVLYRTRW